MAERLRKSIDHHTAFSVVPSSTAAADALANQFTFCRRRAWRGVKLFKHIVTDWLPALSDEMVRPLASSLLRDGLLPFLKVELSLGVTGTADWENGCHVVLRLYDMVPVTWYHTADVGGVNPFQQLHALVRQFASNAGASMRAGLSSQQALIFSQLQRAVQKVG